MSRKTKSTESPIKSFLLSTSFLTNGFWIIGSLIYILGLMLSNHYYGHFPLDLLISISGLLGLPWIIFGCIVVIVRKEIPRLGLKSIKGGWAVFQGILGLITFGILEFVFLYIFLQEIFSK
jgi:hypothetical protein